MWRALTAFSRRTLHAAATLAADDDGGDDDDGEGDEGDEGEGEDALAMVTRMTRRAGEMERSGGRGIAVALGQGTRARAPYGDTTNTITITSNLLRDSVEERKEGGEGGGRRRLRRRRR
jgi:hypothetical protein